jgi:hypothetical protein
MVNKKKFGVLMAAALLCFTVGGAKASAPIAPEVIGVKQDITYSLYNPAYLDELAKQVNFMLGESLRTSCSGTLIDLEYKLILTNYHCVTRYIGTRHQKTVNPITGEVVQRVVEDLKPVTVFQKKYRGHEDTGSVVLKTKIVAHKKSSDLALLQIQADDIPHTMAGRVFAGDRVIRGQDVWVFGNPLGYFDSTITRGIVSSTTRKFKMAGGFEIPFIQMDANGAPGNSGGSAWNSSGELIGVPAAGADSFLLLAVPFQEIQKFLTENCYEDVWNPGAKETHQECMDNKKPKEEPKVDVADELRKILKEMVHQDPEEETSAR